MEEASFSAAFTPNEEFKKWLPLQNKRRGTVELRNLPCQLTIPPDQCIFPEKNDSIESADKLMLPPKYKRNCIQFAPKHFFPALSNQVFDSSSPLISPFFGCYPDVSDPYNNATFLEGWRSAGDSFSSVKLTTERAVMPCKTLAKSNYSTSEPIKFSSNSSKVCNFCRQNGDREKSKSHQLKDDEGKVECPILRDHHCEICRATGDYAHTRTYCPLLKAAGKKPKKNAASLKGTLHDSSGRIRKHPF